MQGARLGGDAPPFEIDRSDGSVRMKANARLVCQVSAEGAYDVLREQHAARVHPERAFHPMGFDLRESLPQLGDRQFRHRLVEGGQGGRRTRGPVGAVAGERERSGRSIEALAEIAPQQIPGGIGIVDHAGIALVIPVGMPDQTMLVHRRGEGIGKGALLKQVHFMTFAHQPPGCGEAHDAAANDDRFHDRAS